MKSRIILVLVAFLSMQSLIAKTDDSTSIISKFKKNEIGVSLNNMNDLLNNYEGLTSSSSISYKRRCNEYALRFSIYTLSNEKKNLIYNFNNDSINSMHASDFYKSQVGIRVGLEKDYLVFNNLIFFYGADINAALLLEKTTPMAFNVQSGFYKSKNSGEFKKRRGMNLGINPTIGVTHAYNSFLSTTLEFDFPLYYSKIQTKSESINFEEKIKISFNLNF